MEGKCPLRKYIGGGMFYYTKNNRGGICSITFPIGVGSWNKPNINDN